MTSQIHMKRSKWLLGALLALSLLSNGNDVQARQAQQAASLSCVRILGVSICFDTCGIVFDVPRCNDRGD